MDVPAGMTLTDVTPHMHFLGREFISDRDPARRPRAPAHPHRGLGLPVAEHVHLPRAGPPAGGQPDRRLGPLRQLRGQPPEPGRSAPDRDLGLGDHRRDERAVDRLHSGFAERSASRIASAAERSWYRRGAGECRGDRRSCWRGFPTCNGNDGAPGALSRVDGERTRRERPRALCEGDDAARSLAASERCEPDSGSSGLRLRLLQPDVRPVVEIGDSGGGAAPADHGREIVTPEAARYGNAPPPKSIGLARHPADVHQKVLEVAAHHGLDERVPDLAVLDVERVLRHPAEVELVVGDCRRRSGRARCRVRSRGSGLRCRARRAR